MSSKGIGTNWLIALARRREFAGRRCRDARRPGRVQEIVMSTKVKTSFGAIDSGRPAMVMKRWPASLVRASGADRRGSHHLLFWRPSWSVVANRRNDTGVSLVSCRRRPISAGCGSDKSPRLWRFDGKLCPSRQHQRSGFYSGKSEEAAGNIRKRDRPAHGIPRVTCFAEERLSVCAFLPGFRGDPRRKSCGTHAATRAQQGVAGKNCPFAELRSSKVHLPSHRPMNVSAIGFAVWMHKHSLLGGTREHEHHSYFGASAYCVNLLRSSPPKKRRTPENKVPASTLKVQVTFLTESQG